MLNEIPFDLRYYPDLTFYENRKLATVFPDIVGKGNLIIQPCTFCNFANLVLIIDNFLVQFDESGYMHILDIVKEEYQSVNLNTARVTNTDIFQQWVMQIGVAAPKLYQAIKRNQQYKYLIAYKRVLCGFTYPHGDEDVPIYFGVIRIAFGIPRNGNTLETKKRAWYYNGEKQTWGQVAHSLFRKEKAQLFDLHSL